MMEKIKLKEKLSNSKVLNLINNTKEKIFDNLLFYGLKIDLLIHKLREKETYEKIKNIGFHVSKTELKETYMMIKLLLKRNRTEQEVKFIKDQLKDLGRIGIIGISGVIPGGTILLIILHKLGIDYRVSAYKEIFNKKFKS